MKKKVTIKTVAEKSGVSISVVSRVLNGKTEQFRISETTAKRVREVAKALNYRPSELARGFRLKKSFSLGLVFPTIKNPFFAEMASMLIEEARKRGYFILIADGEEDPKLEEKAVNLFHDRGIDGLFILPGSKHNDYLEDLYSNGFPIVFIDRHVKKSKIPYVGTDNYKGAFEAISYLLKKGHRKIACIQGTRHAISTQERLRAYSELMEKTHNTTQWAVGSSFTEENGYIQTKRLLSSREKPTAIFAMNNLIAFGVVKAVRELGFNIPKDISLITFDDHKLLSYISPPVTAVAPSKSAIIEMAMNVMIAQVEGKIIAQKRLEFPVSLLVRNSVKKL